MPHRRVRDLVGGSTVLVIGAEGRIGGMLVAGLAGMGPGRLLTAGLSPDAPVDGAEHRVLDIRDRERVSRLIAGVRPDVVFHLATRPVTGTAERDTHDSVCADVLGTRHVVDACAEARVGVLVVASAEESLLLYAHDVRSASKRAIELIVADAAARGRVNAVIARLAHVTDDSPLLRRFRRACREGTVLWLPAPTRRFHLQSAREAAQLLLVAATGARAGARRPCTPSGTWPCRRPPLDLAVGVMREEGVTAMRIADDVTGRPPQHCPDLTGRAGLTGVSPLFNAFEASGAERSLSPDVDVVACRFRLPAAAVRQLDRLADLCLGTREHDMADAFDRFARTLLEANLAQTPRSVVRRIAHLSEPPPPAHDGHGPHGQRPRQVVGGAMNTSERTRLPGTVLLLCLSQIVGSLGLAAGATAGPLLAELITGSAAYGPTAMGALVTGSALAGPAAGTIMRRLGRVWGPAACNLCATAGAAVVVFSVNWGLASLLLGTVLLGAGTHRRDARPLSGHRPRRRAPCPAGDGAGGRGRHRRRGPRSRAARTDRRGGGGGGPAPADGSAPARGWWCSRWRH
ncbi:NAD-dependent epimerase/dehydratase family protein [Streptosporangium vulgare]|uniref:NAD-dependent epimerase/dehydratase family protein n=1 Tax=Streptosporangium vulgare TaxID=46190 RepID=UPI0031D1BF3D